MHAVNNVLGLQLFTAEDFVELVDDYVETQRLAGALEDGEDASWHMDAEGGHLSIELLAFALRETPRLFGAATPRYAVTVALGVAVLDEQDVLGLLLYKPGHFLAIKAQDEELYLLDSLRAPARVTRAAAAALLHEHTCYAVRRV